jgi:hypothetical protein
MGNGFLDSRVVIAPDFATQKAGESLQNPRTRTRTTLNDRAVPPERIRCVILVLFLVVKSVDIGN